MVEVIIYVIVLMFCGSKGVSGALCVRGSILSLFLTPGAMSSSNEYLPSQDGSPTRVMKPKRRQSRNQASARLAKSVKSLSSSRKINIVICSVRLSGDGGVLDSQTTASQYVSELLDAGSTVSNCKSESPKTVLVELATRSVIGQFYAP